MSALPITQSATPAHKKQSASKSAESRKVGSQERQGSTSASPASSTVAKSGGTRESGIQELRLAREERVEMSPSELTAYLSQLDKSAESLFLRVQDGPQSSTREVGRLPELHRLLLEKRVWGAQLKYVSDGRSVVDTLIVGQSTTLRIRL